jgi:ribulose-bisphosphate carboxylase large chain
MPVTIHYTITANNENEARKTAVSICYEQSVELPDDVLTEAIRSTRLGRLENLTSTGTSTWAATITFPDKNVGNEITQFLNVLFGNVSMFGNVEINGLDWKHLPEKLFSGPVFGIDGVREKLGIKNRRALSCTALKPLGSNSKTLAGYAASFASGGIDIIKDDHGLANQSSSPFSERLKACTGAIREVNIKRGGNSVYYPNITADGSALFERYEQAFEAGAGGVLVSPHLTGLSALQQLSQMDPPCR